MSKLFEYYGVSKKKGEFLFKEGEQAEHLYMIRSGRVQISKRIGKTDEEIQILGEGEFVGEMAVINSEPRSATAIALEDCELISMNKESFDNSVRDNHKFAISVIELLSDRLRETDELITDLISREREQELYAEIIIELLKNGKREKSGQWILIPFEPLWDRVNKRFSGDMEFSKSLLDNLIREKKVELKKGQGQQWIAFRIK
jgi:CRP/FNR family cyclic AMP-dependent transcriptional regulator